MSSHTESRETIEGTPILTDDEILQTKDKELKTQLLKERTKIIFQKFHKKLNENEIEEIKFIITKKPNLNIERIDIKFLNLEYTYSIFLNIKCSIIEDNNNYYIISKCIDTNVSVVNIRRTKLAAFNNGLVMYIFSRLKDYNEKYYVLNDYENGDQIIDATIEKIDDNEIHLTIVIKIKGKVNLSWFAGGLHKKRNYKSKKNVKNLHKRRTRARPRRP
jgi:hypothetical protein